MALETGERLGPYVIAGPIGAGGMGEVYRARDTRLDRDVAIKVIPASLARDPDRVARFEREAKAVAALSHPNILTIHDTGTAGDTLYVVMELLAGETLGDRLKQGPLPIRKACEIGGLVARGLAAAHEKGVVHRDVKPDNIFLTDNGQVKILDFGLARSSTEATGASETRAVLTDAGAVLGTVGYMAPEQVRGLAADARADLFALGVVMYEMLSGQRAFSRGTAAETMTAILNDDAPDVSSAQRQWPPALDRIVRHCLEKNPAERFQTARDVAFALDSLSGSSASGAAIVSGGAPSSRARERLAWALATLSLAALAAWLAFGRPAARSVPPEAYRATLLLPEGVSVATTLIPGLRFALSPDGQKLAFIGDSASGRALWIQTLSDSSAIKIERSHDAYGPFWSPDSRTVAFFVDRQLMKVDAGGGRPGAIAGVQGTGAWSPDGQYILVADDRDGVRVVSPADGAVRQVIAPRMGLVRFYPAFLPGGSRFMYGEYEPGNAATYGWYGNALDGASPMLLLSRGLDADRSNAQVASGHFVWARDQNLLALPTDDLGAKSAPEPMVIAGPVEGQSRSSAAFSISQTGALVYQAAVNANRSSLLWFSRTGQRLSQLGVDSDYSNLAASPDGRNLLVSQTDGTSRSRDIWVLDMVRGVPTRLTFDPADERSAVWSPDGQAIVYRGRGGELFTRPLGSGDEQPFVIDKRSKDPQGWSADGRFFLYRATGNGNDLWIKPAASAGAPYPFIATKFGEAYGEFSPDGHWLAYVSDESGAQEVYVTAFPSGQGKTRVSSDGGSFARWRRDGRQMYYLSPDGKMMAASVSTSASGFQVDKTQTLFQTTVTPGPGVPYVVSADGQRFLINSIVPSSDPPSLSIVFNWPALITKK